MANQRPLLKLTHHWQRETKLCGLGPSAVCFAALNVYEVRPAGREKKNEERVAAGLFGNERIWNEEIRRRNKSNGTDTYFRSIMIYIRGLIPDQVPFVLSKLYSYMLIE